VFCWCFNSFYVNITTVWIFPPMAQQLLVGQGLLIVEASWSHSDTPHSVGLLWTSDQPVAETSTWQHTTITRDRHSCPGGIRTHNPNKRAAADPRPRPRGHWDRPMVWILKRKPAEFVYWFVLFALGIWSTVESRLSNYVWNGRRALERRIGRNDEVKLLQHVTTVLRHPSFRLGRLTAVKNSLPWLGWEPGTSWKQVSCNIHVLTGA
jgi:hypothetical protein